MRLGRANTHGLGRRKAAFREASREEQEHTETEVGRPGPEVGVSRARCPQHRDCNPGLFDGTCPTRAGAAARAGWRLEGSLGAGP